MKNANIVYATFCLATLVALFGLGGCASWMDAIKNDGEEATPVAETRAPASNGRAVTIDNGSDAPGAKLVATQPEAIGANLGAQEFAAPTRQVNNRAAQGFRSGADPWDGTGPVNEGSLWNPDSQDNFYFSKNLLHKIGDILIVKVEADVNDALNTKVSALLDRSNVNQVVADEAGKAVGTAVAKKVGTALGNDNVAQAVGAATAARTTAALEPKTKYIDLEEIPVRITAVMPRNTFKVEGARRVSIRNAPYQLKLSGVVRDEDIGGNATVASNKVFESKMELTR